MNANPSSSVHQTVLLRLNELCGFSGDFRHYIRDDAGAFGQAQAEMDEARSRMDRALQLSEKGLLPKQDLRSALFDLGAHHFRDRGEDPRQIHLHAHMVVHDVDTAAHGLLHHDHVEMQIVAVPLCRVATRGNEYAPAAGFGCGFGFAV